jgi:hypothetical protein
LDKGFFLGEKKNAKVIIFWGKKKSHWPSSSTRRWFTPIFIMWTSYKNKKLIKKSFYILTTCWEQCVENMAIFLEMSFDFWHLKKIKWNTWQEYLFIYFEKTFTTWKKSATKKKTQAKAKAKATTSRWMACYKLSPGWK